MIVFVKQHPVEIHNGSWRASHQNTRPPLVHRPSQKNGSREGFYLPSQGQPSPSSSEADSSPVTAWEYRNKQQQHSPYAHFPSPSSAESEAPPHRNFPHYPLSSDTDGSAVPPRDPRTMRPVPHHQQYPRHHSHLSLPTPQAASQDGVTPRDPRKRTQLPTSSYTASSSPLHSSTPLPSRPSPPRHHVVPSPYTAGSHSYHHLMEEPRPHYSTNSTMHSTELHQQRRNLSRHMQLQAAIPDVTMTRRDLHSAAGSVIASTAVTCSLPYSLVAAAASREHSTHHIPLPRRGVQVSPSSSKESTNAVSSLGAHSISHTTGNKNSHSPQSSVAISGSERTIASATKTNHVALEHSYAKSTHFLGQPRPPSEVSFEIARSLLSEVIPKNSEKQVPKVENLLVERVEHILVTETGAWPPPLNGFDLGMETESDSSCDSSFDTEEHQWMPLSLPVSFPQLLLHKKSTNSNIISSETSSRQSSPATTTEPKSQRNLYWYATRKGTTTSETRQVKKREVRFAADDENSKPEGQTKYNGVMEVGSDPGISQRLRKRKAQSIESTLRVSIELSVKLACMIRVFIAQKHQKQKGDTSSREGSLTKGQTKRRFKVFTVRIVMVGGYFCVSCAGFCTRGI